MEQVSFIASSPHQLHQLLLWVEAPLELHGNLTDKQENSTLFYSAPQIGDSPNVGSTTSPTLNIWEWFFRGLLGIHAVAQVDVGMQPHFSNFIHL